ncbi:putative Mg2+ transporter-C (MgtC) family protein [Pseudarcicella hirudinis]|uniref:Putative Mg2+ transporter-C (MgtC) family protein n=1 Tax=Pseudarcicella hirudinis TaxID=1079859 RepID=A0A1I5PJ28_9BACT|nr:MgtC/SapB family protein [Pseudarcicella hirudinis]SFP34039.1 putative Mg2+ transporter-C (MgtC) family protein [Pseudarcicella hirudinis]
MNDITEFFQKAVQNEDLLKLVASVFVGALIGAEREYRSKSAGLRTFTLICLGSTIFTILSLKMGLPVSRDRIAANILTGIGFIGAGVIFKQDDRIKGLTTATIIWVTAALGMAIGSGHIYLSFLGAFSVYFVLGFFVKLEGYMEKFGGQTRNYKIVCVYEPDIFEKFSKVFEEQNLFAKRDKQIIEGKILTSYWSVRGASAKHEKLIRHLMENPEVQDLEF